MREKMTWASFQFIRSGCASKGQWVCSRVKSISATQRIARRLANQSPVRSFERLLRMKLKPDLCIKYANEPTSLRKPWKLWKPWKYLQRNYSQKHSLEHLIGNYWTYFSTTILFYDPLKKSENLWFSEVFKGIWKWNIDLKWIKTLNWTCKYPPVNKLSEESWIYKFPENYRVKFV